MQKIINPWIDIPGYNCFGCAPNNTAGVRMDFYEEGDEVISVWKLEPQYQGWFNTLHGGIQSVLLDEICAWVVIAKLKTVGVTAKMETRFKKSVYTTDKYVLLRAHITQTHHNLISIRATLQNAAGELCAEAICTYFTFSKEKSTEMHYMPCGRSGVEVSLADVIAAASE